MDTYKARQFNLSNLKGISEETLDVHFKLYEGYVKETNKLNKKIAEFVKGGKVDQEEFAAFSFSDGDVKDPECSKKRERL